MEHIAKSSTSFSHYFQTHVQTVTKGSPSRIACASFSACSRPSVLGEKPFFCASDWSEGPENDSDWRKRLQWGVEQSILLTGELKPAIDMSFGETGQRRRFPLRSSRQGTRYRGMQIGVMMTPRIQTVSRRFRLWRLDGVSWAPVGMILTPLRANDFDLLAEGKADITLMTLPSCEFLHDPHWSCVQPNELGVAVKPVQHEHAWQRF